MERGIIAIENTNKATFVFQFPQAAQSVHLLKRLGETSRTIVFFHVAEDHSVHGRHLIANHSHLALAHKLNDRLNGWPRQYAKEHFFGYFAKYPVKDSRWPVVAVRTVQKTAILCERHIRSFRPCVIVKSPN